MYSVLFELFHSKQLSAVVENNVIRAVTVIQNIKVVGRTVKQQAEAKAL